MALRQTQLKRLQWQWVGAFPSLLRLGYWQSRAPGGIHISVEPLSNLKGETVAWWWHFAVVRLLPGHLLRQAPRSLNLHLSPVHVRSGYL